MRLEAGKERERAREMLEKKSLRGLGDRIEKTSTSCSGKKGGFTKGTEKCSLLLLTNKTPSFDKEKFLAKKIARSLFVPQMHTHTHRESDIQEKENGLTKKTRRRQS